MPKAKEAKAPPAAAVTTQQAPRGPIVDTWKAKSEQSIKLSFDAIPLLEVLSFLSDKTRIRFSVQQRVLEEAGLAVDQPITLSTNEVTAVAALQAFQDTYPDLRFVLRDYGVLLTTKDFANDHGYTSIVPDSDTASGGQGGGGGFF